MIAKARQVPLLLGGLFALLLSPTSFTQDTAGYAVKPGDVLAVSVWKEPDLTRPVLIQPDGAFSFPLAGQIDARGKTPTQIQQLLVERLRKYISDPVVTASVQEVRGNKVFVIGQVTKPGEIIMNPGVNVMQALSIAGGTTPFAAVNNIIVLRRAPGTKQQVFQFRYQDVAKGKDLDQNIDLQAGDVVVVP
jgi:polysaccharide biosynthesis/export protein